MKNINASFVGGFDDEAEGWPEDGIVPGTKWEDILMTGLVGLWCF